MGIFQILCLCRFILCGYFVMWPSVMRDECSIPIGHPFVCKIYNKSGSVVRSCDLARALAIPWRWASLACSTAFIFEPALIRLLIWFYLSRWLPNQLCRLPFLILLKLSCHILLRLFAHRPTTLILRLMFSSSYSCCPLSSWALSSTRSRMSSLFSTMPFLGRDSPISSWNRL